MAGKPRKIYRPNYAEVYPGIDIDDAVMKVLKRSDRKMEYQECDIKYPRIKRDETGKVVGILPPREDSYDEHLEFNRQFEDSGENTELDAVAHVHAQKLREAISMLDEQERTIIHALYYAYQTEQQCADNLGIKQQSLHQMKNRILVKLRKILKF